MEQLGHFTHAAEHCPAFWVVAIILLPALLITFVIRTIAPDRSKPFAPIFAVQTVSVFWILVALMVLPRFGVPMSETLRQPLVLTELGILLISTPWFLVSPNLAPLVLLLLLQLGEFGYGLLRLGAHAEGVETTLAEGLVMFRVVAALILALGIVMLLRHQTLREVWESRNG